LPARYFAELPANFWVPQAIDKPQKVENLRIIPLSTMRLRIETKAPLPPLKTWLNINLGFFFGTRTFNDLCRRLISDFDLPNNIALQFEGFDLFGKDAVEAILRKDDLVQ